MAAVTPQKKQYKFGSFCPAAIIVEATTSSSRWDVRCKWQAARWEQTKNRMLAARNLTQYKVNFKLKIW
jgi:hypothetical protein